MYIVHDYTCSLSIICAEKKYPLSVPFFWEMAWNFNAKFYWLVRYSYLHIIKEQQVITFIFKRSDVNEF